MPPGFVFFMDPQQLRLLQMIRGEGLSPVERACFVLCAYGFTSSQVARLQLPKTRQAVTRARKRALKALERTAPIKPGSII